jgi:hypothetical protein
MKRQIRRWLNRYKNQLKKNQLEKLIGTNLKSIIESCESILLEETGELVYTKFRDLGGANNHGMLLHYSITTNHPVAISKVEEHVLAEREYRFLAWQNKHRKGLLAAIPLGMIQIGNTAYSCFISSVLDKPKTFSYSQAESLFQRIGEQPGLLSHLALDGCKENLIFELDGSTRIKSILVNLVSNFKTKDAEDFYKKFLLDRKGILSNYKDFYINLKLVMDDAYCVLNGYDLSNYEGLVHGDFKQQNILNDLNKYKVIDCQYYTYGIRLWDLAFLYSKDERGFESIKSNISQFRSLNERLLLVFFYLLASLINVKKKRIKKVIIKKTSPALEYLTLLLSASE